MTTLNLTQQLRLGLKLTPQQVQYLKLLQLPNLALEQRIKTELEINPMLEVEEDLEPGLEENSPEDDVQEEEKTDESTDEGYTIDDYLNDDQEGHKSPEAKYSSNGDEEYEAPLPSTPPLSERLLAQFRMLEADDTDVLLAEEIIGNVDEDGYLRRELHLIVQDLNLSFGLEIPDLKAEEVLRRIQQLDPPGIAARSLQECLVAQIRSGVTDHSLRELALRILEHQFEDLKLKRYDVLGERLGVGTETLRKVVELIQHLNPKPGEGEFSAQENYVTPDFIVEKEEGDFLISLNDRTIPTLRLNRAYRELIAPKGKRASKETKDFIKQKFEAAKWFIASIHQRRETLLKVMRVKIGRASCRERV